MPPPYRYFGYNYPQWTWVCYSPEWDIPLVRGKTDIDYPFGLKNWMDPHEKVYLKRALPINLAWENTKVRGLVMQELAE